MASPIRETHIWKRLFRISTSLFDSLHATLESMLAHQITCYRKPVHPATKIAAFIMNSGGLTYEATASQLGTGESTINLAVHEELQKLCQVCRASVAFPKSSKDVNAAIEGFKKISGPPNCVGAIDFTHIPWLMSPSDQYFDYRCYKGIYKRCNFLLSVQLIGALRP